VIKPTRGPCRHWPHTPKPQPKATGPASRPHPIRATLSTRTAPPSPHQPGPRQLLCDDAARPPSRDSSTEKRRRLPDASPQCHLACSCHSAYHPSHPSVPSPLLTPPSSNYARDDESAAPPMPAADINSPDLVLMRLRKVLRGRWAAKAAPSRATAVWLTATRWPDYRRFAQPGSAAIQVVPAHLSVNVAATAAAFLCPQRKRDSLTITSPSSLPPSPSPPPNAGASHRAMASATQQPARSCPSAPSRPLRRRRRVGRSAHGGCRWLRLRQGP